MSRLEKRFRKLDSDGNNALSVAEFLQMPELRDNPIVQRVVQVVYNDDDGDDKVIMMIKSQNVGTERQPHCLRGGVKYSFFDYIYSVKGNLNARFHICLTSSELEILASVVQLPGDQN